MTAIDFKELFLFWNFVWNFWALILNKQIHADLKKHKIAL